MGETKLGHLSEGDLWNLRQIAVNEMALYYLAGKPRQAKRKEADVEAFDAEILRRITKKGR